MTGVVAGPRRDFGSEQPQNEPILIRRPHRAVPPQKRCAGTLLAAKAQRSVDQPDTEPFEPDRHLDELAPKLRRDAVDHTPTIQAAIRCRSWISSRGSKY